MRENKRKAIWNSYKQKMEEILEEDNIKAHKYNHNIDRFKGIEVRVFGNMNMEWRIRKRRFKKQCEYNTIEIS